LRKKEDDDLINLTRSPWTLVKNERYKYTNDVLDSILTWNLVENFKFLGNGNVEYTTDFIETPMVGKWWFNEYKTHLYTDLEITASYTYSVLTNAKIIKLTNDSLIMKTDVNTVTNSINNDVIIYEDYKYFSH